MPLPRHTTISTNEHAFNILSAQLNTLHNETPWEIEILPSALCPPGEPSVVRDGNCIGIPKKLLLAAFQYALAITSTSPRSSETNPGNCILDTLTLTATAIILLAAPEHLTASNIRKRHLLSLSQVTPSLLPAALATEFQLLDSLLTSPLHRHTKSPTLWSHRRWLITQFSSYISVRTPLSPSSTAILTDPLDSATRILHKELQIVLRAGSQHPRNYYAWCHLRFLLSPRGPYSQPLLSLPLLAQGIVPQVQAFCRRHVGDTSGWSALLFLLVVGADARLAEIVLRNMLDMVLQLRWRGEAAWGFLRTVVAGGVGCLGEAPRREVLVALKARWNELGLKGVEDAGSLVGEQGLMEEVMGMAVHWTEKNWMDSS